MKIFKILFTIIIFLLLIPGSVIGIKKVKINQINCVSQYDHCNSLVTDSFKNYQNQSYFEVKKNLKQNLENNPFVRNYRLNFLYPDKILARISENKPKYALKYQTGDIALVSNDGIVLKYDNNTSLPKALLPEQNKKYETGSKISDSDLFALNIIFYLSSLYKIKSAQIKSDGVDVELTDYPKLIFPLEGDMQLLIGSANFILSEINTINNKTVDNKIEIVDLRFKNPVLR